LEGEEENKKSDLELRRNKKQRRNEEGRERIGREKKKANDVFIFSFLQQVEVHEQLEQHERQVQVHVAVGLQQLQQL